MEDFAIGNFVENEHWEFIPKPPPKPDRVVAIIGSRQFQDAWLPQFQYVWPATKKDAKCKWAARQFMEKELAKRVGVYDLVISGGAIGPDSVGYWWAHAHLSIKPEQYKAEWDKYGKAAGFKRNTVLAEKAQWIIAFWDGKSRGTKDTILKAHALGKRVTVIYADGRVRDNNLGDDDPHGRP